MVVLAIISLTIFVGACLFGIIMSFASACAEAAGEEGFY